MIPAVIGHLISVKMSKPRLNLPKCLPASFGGVKDMEAEAPAAPPPKKGGTGGMVFAAVGVAAMAAGYFLMK